MRSPASLSQGRGWGGGQRSRLLTVEAEVRKLCRGTSFPPSPHPRLSQGATRLPGKSWSPFSVEPRGLGAHGQEEQGSGKWQETALWPPSGWLCRCCLGGTHLLKHEYSAILHAGLFLQKHLFPKCPWLHGQKGACLQGGLPTTHTPQVSVVSAPFLGSGGGWGPAVSSQRQSLDTSFSKGRATGARAGGGGVGARLPRQLEGSGLTPRSPDLCPLPYPSCRAPSPHRPGPG